MKNKKQEKKFSSLPRDIKRIQSLFVDSEKEIWDMYQEKWKKYSTHCFFCDSKYTDNPKNWTTYKTAYNQINKICLKCYADRF